MVSEGQLMPSSGMMDANRGTTMSRARLLTLAAHAGVYPWLRVYPGPAPLCTRYTQSIDGCERYGRCGGPTEAVGVPTNSAISSHHKTMHARGLFNTANYAKWLHANVRAAHRSRAAAAVSQQGVKD